MTQLILSNSEVGTHACNITKQAEETISKKHLLGKFGTKESHVKICGESDFPIGVITDEAEVGDIVNVALLGSADTLNVIANEAIQAGNKLFPAENGKVKTSGTKMIGIALTSALAGQIVEFMSCIPQEM